MVSIIEWANTIAAQAAACFAPLDAWLASLHPYNEGIDSAQLLLTAATCWVGGRLMTGWQG